MIWMSVMLQNQIILLPELNWLGTHQVPLLAHPEPPAHWCGWCGSSIMLLVVALVVAADGDTVGSGYRWPRPIHRVGQDRCSRLVFGIWAVGNVIPCLLAVETGPSIVVVGGDLAGIALWGFHGVLAPELCVRGLGACHLWLGPILDWGLRSWCSITGAPWCDGSGF